MNAQRRALSAWQAAARGPRAALMLLVRGYRLLLKPWLGNACRFEPTCSAYALQALEQHGAARGSVLVAGRLLRCQPWCAGGCDPVPDRFRMPGAALFTSLGLPSRRPRASRGPTGPVTPSSIDRRP